MKKSSYLYSYQVCLLHLPVCSQDPCLINLGKKGISVTKLFQKQEIRLINFGNDTWMFSVVLGVWLSDTAHIRPREPCLVPKLKRDGGEEGGEGR